MFELKKIGIVRRASALLLDIILLLVLATGFMWIISLICQFEKHVNRYSGYLEQYDNDFAEFSDEYAKDISEHYGFIYEETEKTVENEDGSKETEKSFTIKTAEGVEASFDDVIKKLIDDKGEYGEEVIDAERMTAAYESYSALSTPLSKAAYEFELIVRFLFLMASLGFLLSYLILEFVIPIILKNGQTVGKKVFNIAVVKPNCVKISILALFARTILGKYAIETMFPVLLVFLFFFGGMSWVALVLFAAVALFNIILFLVTKNKTPIHDIFAATVAVDMKTQMIYASEEELAQKKSLAEIEKAEGTSTNI